MAFAPRPLPCETIDGLCPPLAGFSYFRHADALPFEPQVAGLSSTNAWWLADASFLIYGDAPFVEEVFQKSPLPDQGFHLDWIGTADDNRGMVLANDEAMIAVFRGTRVQVHSLLDSAEVVLYNQSDLRTDSQILFRTAQVGGRVHSGFSGALAEIMDRFDAIQKARRPGQKLWLAGHSLGGALATLAAAHVGSDAVAGLYTYGAPRVGDAAFAAVLPKQSHYRFVHRDDWVPATPPEFLGYAHGGILQPVAGGRPRNLRGDLASGLQAIAATAANTVRNLRFKVGDLPFQIGGLADHAPIYYATLLWNAKLAKEASTAGSDPEARGCC